MMNGNSMKSNPALLCFCSILFSSYYSD